MDEGLGLSWYCVAIKPGIVAITPGIVAPVCMG